MVGWTIFRAHSLDQARALASAMVQPGLAGQVAGTFIGNDTIAVAIIAAAICALPRVPGFNRARHFVFLTPGRTVAVQTVMSLVFVAAVGKAVADPFKPFLYFRF
jgi:alginate O-acetyltransferase complex protein AlgI